MSAQSTSADAVRSAALNHSDEMGCYSFVLPVPNTTPQLFVAFGDLESCMSLLQSKKDVAANDGGHSRESHDIIRAWCASCGMPAPSEGDCIALSAALTPSFAEPSWIDEPPDWCTPKEEEIWQDGYDTAMSSCRSVNTPGAAS